MIIENLINFKSGKKTYSEETEATFNGKFNFTYFIGGAYKETIMRISFENNPKSKEIFI